MPTEFHLFRRKREWCPEWLWRLFRPVVLYPPFRQIFTESPSVEDWGK